MGPPRINPELKNIARRTNARYVLAAHITGKPKPDDVTNTSNLPMSDKSPESSAPEDAAKADPAQKDAAQDKPAAAASSASKGAADKDKVAEKEKEPRPINAVVVCDIDCLSSTFFAIRARGPEADDEVNLDLDNVSFVLNILDVLAGDERFVEVCSRRPAHRELTRITEAKAKASERVDDVRESATKEFDAAKDEAQKAMEKKIAELKKRPGLSRDEAITELALVQERERPILNTKIEQAKRKHDDDIRKVENELAVEVRSWQDWYKLWAVLVPPIPPLLVGCWVFFNRRAREREGVSKSRLR
jgi:ABC-2 type transport system permease protein